ncbi:MAG: FadR/GntR family transcriptional regulator [Syntrophaceae bacterium]
MKDMLKPIKTDSLKEVFIARFEELILSGKFAIGQKLPSERELAQQLGVSRPVVHEGLVDLQTKGLVSMRPRVGTVVNDYRSEGSLAILSSLIDYHQGRFEPKLLESLLAMRRLIEIETARLAAKNRTREHLAALDAIIKQEQRIDHDDIDTLTRLDYAFHHQIAMASANMVYPLFLNSFKEVYTNLSGQFFSDPRVAPAVKDSHKRIAQAIADKDAEAASMIMAKILTHGERHLKAVVARQGGKP